MAAKLRARMVSACDYSPDDGERERERERLKSSLCARTGRFFLSRMFAHHHHRRRRHHCHTKGRTCLLVATATTTTAQRTTNTLALLRVPEDIQKYCPHCHWQWTRYRKWPDRADAFRSAFCCPCLREKCIHVFFFVCESQPRASVQAPQTGSRDWVATSSRRHPQVASKKGGVTAYRRRRWETRGGCMVLLLMLESPPHHDPTAQSKEEPKDRNSIQVH